MTTRHIDRIVEDYLRRLNDELGMLPVRQRREIMDEIRDHLAERRADMPAETEADLRDILDRLGDPHEIADEARRRFGLPDATAGPLEIAVLLAMTAGAIALPWLPVGLAIGVLLLWWSRCWTKRAKYVGGYLPLGAAIALTAASYLLGPWIGLSALAGLTVAGLVLPLVGASYLTVRLGRRLRPLAWAGVAAVLLVVTVPAAVSLMPSRTSAFIAGDAAPRPVTSGKTTCGAFYAAKHFPGRGAIGTNVGICWDGGRVWTAWGPNCPVSSTGLAFLTVHRCTVRAQGRVLVVDADITERATTAPAFGGSQGYGWVINPDGTFQTV
jgi:uncharacterized membrane protein